MRSEHQSVKFRFHINVSRSLNQHAIVEQINEILCLMYLEMIHIQKIDMDAFICMPRPFLMKIYLGIYNSGQRIFWYIQFGHLRSKVRA